MSKKKYIAPSTSIETYLTDEVLVVTSPVGYEWGTGADDSDQLARMRNAELEMAEVEERARFGNLW